MRSDTEHPEDEVGISPIDAVECVYLAVIQGEDGESVYTVTGPHDTRLPVVALGERDLPALGAYARGQADHTGQTVRIICFTKRLHHETYLPSATQDKR